MTDRGAVLIENGRARKTWCLPSGALVAAPPQKTTFRKNWKVEKKRERESFLLLLFEDVVCRIFESSDKYLTCEQLPRKTCKHVRDTSLSLSSLLVRISIPRGNEIARYRLSIDPPVPLTLSRNNGRINLPEARDHSYRDHSVRKSKRFPAKKEEGETNLFFPLGGNFTARFNESMGRFGSRREKTDIAQTTNFFSSFVSQRIAESYSFHHDSLFRGTRGARGCRTRFPPVFPTEPSFASFFL